MKFGCFGKWARQSLAAPVILLFGQTANAEPAACIKNIASFQPKAGIVGSEETARSVAMTYLKSIYGAAQIEGQKPFKVSFRDGVWTVMGSLASNTEGGVAEISICRRNGNVLRIFHDK